MGAMFLPALFVLMAPAAAWAHDDTSGALVLTVDQGRVVGTGKVEFAELGLEDTTGDGLIDSTELSQQEASVAPTLVGMVRDHVALEVNGASLPIIGAGLSLQGSGAEADPAASEYVGVAFVSGAFTGDLRLLNLAWSYSSPNNAIVFSDIEVAVLGHLREDGAVSFTLDGWATASSFLHQGIEHIRLGPDHLLFLVALALGVLGVRSGRAAIWPAVKLVTGFTVGHTVSLCLAYFNVVSVPAAIVEPLIALSIVAAAVLALRRKVGDYRWWIAGIVGLVHGLGFASSLSSLGLATTDHVIALVSFNLGIDLAQTVAVVLVLIASALLTRVLPKRFEIIRISACVAIGVMASGLDLHPGAAVLDDSWPIDSSIAGIDDVIVDLDSDRNVLGGRNHG